jgi:aminoglycoside 3-N-acetyltransferase
MGGQMTVTFRDFLVAFRQLRIDRAGPVIAHASLTAFGQVQGGAQTLLGALLASFEALVMPTFTYKTMVTPLTGPPDNASEYSKGRDRSLLAEIFYPDMPADRLMGVTAEALRRHPLARRSLHPILSFSGVNAQEALDAQSYAEPLATIGVLTEAQGWVLLLGVDHTVNTSIHYAESQAGRKQFVRWALTQHGARECPGFPGCSDGFQAITPRLEGITRRAQVGPATIQAIPLPDLVTTVRAWIAGDPLALLCGKPTCERCEAVRRSVSVPAEEGRG